MGITRFPHGISSFGVPVLPGTSGLLHSGNVFWVDSGDENTSDGNDGSFTAPFKTLDYAVGQCTASNGDIIYVKEGHVETVTAAAGLDLDVAGITIVFLGEGNGRGYITFTTAVGADMDVDAADITLINPRFVAGIDALTGPIDVNAARFKMYNATWQEATDMNTTDCVVADANADYMLIDGFEFVDANAGGTQKQSFIQVAGANGVIIKNVKCTGDFATGVIENGTAWVDAYLEGCILDNANSSPTVAVLLQATSSGAMKDCHFRVASGTTYITANNDMQFFECYGTGTDATAGEKVGTLISGDVETQVSTAVSQTASVGIQTSTVTSKVDSVGITSSTNTSRISSVGIQASTVNSMTASVGIQGSTVVSKADSIGVSASQIQSMLTSIALVISSIENQVS